MLKEKKVIWSPHYYEWDATNNVFSQEDEKQFEEDYENENTLDSISSGLNLVPISKKMMQTPFGMFDVDDALNPYKIFRFWMGNTNFDITEEVAELLENTEGVEVLKILSPYRFIIAIGDAFSINDVRLDIQNRLCHDNNTYLNIQLEIEKLKNDIKFNKHWAIYCFPNGKIDFCVANNDEELTDFNKKLQTYQESQKLSKGQLISSKND